ncbi:uncharacterized protein LOC129591141 [Paramacrobiotus metropolitanus]|uniref:uncharacterized protein LOC129591141 n=1 Tax=Paramacrobiotus metropolitanus TaxID=2943436 RepID=UPI002445C365|nr:uncharacterized protein LOC129591141 [Paramacrobiotus metropolitanus]
MKPNNLWVFIVSCCYKSVPTGCVYNTLTLQGVTSVRLLPMDRTDDNEKWGDWLVSVIIQYAGAISSNPVERDTDIAELLFYLGHQAAMHDGYKNCGAWKMLISIQDSKHLNYKTKEQYFAAYAKRLLKEAKAEDSMQYKGDKGNPQASAATDLQLHTMPRDAVACTRDQQIDSEIKRLRDIIAEQTTVIDSLKKRVGSVECRLLPKPPSF